MLTIKKIMTAATAAVLTSGCTAAEAFNGKNTAAEPVSVAVVTTVVEHCAPIDPDLFYEDVFNAVHSGGNAYFINADSDPSVTKAEFPRLKKSLSESQKQDAHQKAVNQYFKEELPSVLAPDSAETDTYLAVCEAVKALKNDTVSEKKLIVVSHGIITSGLLNMKDSVISNIDTDQIIAFLQENYELQDMSGITVEFWFADPCGEQKLYGPDRKALQQLWQTLFETAGAEVTFHSSVSTTSAPLSADAAYHVSVIPTIAPVLNLPQMPEISENDIIELPETEIAFKPDSAELLDPNEAEERIRQVAEIMAAQDDTRYIIAGFTATSGNADSAIKLSKERAETVKQLLCDTGLNSERFTVTGLGYETDNIFHINDIRNGKLDETLASGNRRILILIDNDENERKTGLAE